MNELKEALEREILQELDDISRFETGSEEKSKAISDLAKLYNLNLDHDGRILEENRDSFDESYKEEQMDAEAHHQKIDRWVRIGIAGAELVIPLIFSGIWMKRGFKFEETGTYTSNTFKWLFGKFRLAKK